MIDSVFLIQNSLSPSSVGKNIFPTAYLPISGRFISIFLASALKKLSGNAIRIPAPSPVFSSNPHPPL